MQLMAAIAQVQSSFLLLFLVLALPIVYLFRKGRLKKQASASEAKPVLAPGPVKLPVIGNLHQLASAKNLHRCLWELSKQYGPVMHLKLGRVPTLVISSAAMAKEVLRTHDVDCFNRPPSTAGFTLSCGYLGVAFAPYGESWREMRRIYKEEYLSSKKVASLRSVVEEEIGRTMEWIASRTGEAPLVDVSDSSRLLINSIICRTAFGRSCHDMGEGRFYRILREAQEMFGGFFLGDYLPQLGWVDVLRGMRGRLRRTFLEFKGFFEQLIEEHDGFNHEGKILDALLRAYKDGNDITKDEIKAALMDIFVGGTDAASTIIEWTMSELIRHPEAMARAQEEVRDCAGRKGKVDESDLRQLRYLKAVIKETMRLHPPTVLLIPRESVRGFKLQGYDVSPKTTIYINTFAIGMDPGSWERPGEFLPERFLDNSTDDTVLNNHHDFKLLAFGEGRRACPGMSLGLLMTELGLANLLYCFGWSLPAGMAAQDVNVGEATGVTLHRSVALCLVATRYDPLED